jgi:hypothetical protein
MRDCLVYETVTYGTRLRQRAVPCIHRSMQPCYPMSLHAELIRVSYRETRVVPDLAFGEPVIEPAVQVTSD